MSLILHQKNIHKISKDPIKQAFKYRLEAGGDYDGIAETSKQNIDQFQNELYYFKMELVGSGCEFK